MDFTLPETSTDFGRLIAEWAQEVPEKLDFRSFGDELAETGFFEIAHPDGPDPEHAALNQVIALRAVARAGLAGPFAETVHATTLGLVEHDSGATWVAAGIDLERDGARLTPFGRDADRVLVDGAAVRSAGDGVPADVKMLQGQTWEPGIGSFQQIAGEVAWRSGAALVSGYGERMLELALLQVRDRIAFGKKLVSFQAPRFKLAEVHWRLEALRDVVHDAASRADAGDPRATAMSALAWLNARQVARLVSRNVHQVMGAIGFQEMAGVVQLTGIVTTWRLGLAPAAASAVAWDGFDLASPVPVSNLNEAYRTR